MLNTETNTPEMEKRIMSAVVRELQLPLEHHHMAVNFEHGQWWATCNDCGAQWSVVDAEGPGSIDGFDFEQVTEGNGCNERS
jgi:hypothetical protein